MSRPTVAELIEEILGTVDDEEYINTDVLKFLNRCNIRLAGTLDTPDLATVGNIDTVIGQNFTNLPSDYFKGLNQWFNPTCYNTTTNDRIKIFGSRRLVDKKFRILDQTGAITAVALYGRTLYYQKIPEAVQTLQISYFKRPDELTVDGQFPAYIPEGYIHELFFNYACSYLFSPIEDGIEDEKTNTMFHKGEFNIAWNELKQLYGPDQDDPYFMDNSSGDFDFDCM